MRVLAKSLLDLIPLAIVTIIISVLASQSLDELSVNYNEIITEDLAVVSRLNDAGKAIDNWKSAINEGVLNSAENPDLATQNFEKLLTEKENLLKSLTDAINILEAKKARFDAGDNGSSQQSENETGVSENQERIKVQIESLKFLKENNLPTIEKRSKNVQSLTQFSAFSQRDLLFSMNSSVEDALKISMEGTAKSLEITYTFQTDLKYDIDDSEAITANVGKFPSVPVILLDINSVFQEIKNIQGTLASSFGKYMQKDDELVEELEKKIEVAKSLSTYLSNLEKNFKKEFMEKESYRNVFGEYFNENYAERLIVPINNYSYFYTDLTDALLKDDQQLKQLETEKSTLFSNLSTASTTINSIISEIKK